MQRRQSSAARAPSATDLRGTVRLAADATAGLADLVEAMHERIARLPGVSPPARQGRTRGITGLVYKSIRGVTRLVGGSLEGLLNLLAPALTATGPAAQREPWPERESIVAALNGVLGDHLLASGNPLATRMAFRSGGVALALDRGALAERLPRATGRLLVLVHGLCMNDLQWQRKGHDHGNMLARAFGYTPVYLHYNTGQHVSVNGRALAEQLERLLAQWPQPLERTVLLCHSMGGLLARSALHYGRQAGQRWPALIDDVVFLGTPHHGAPLERAGHGLDLILGALPYAAPMARLGKVRSAGITDLRHGLLVDEDWQGRDRFAPGSHPRQHLPLPRNKPLRPRCFALATSTGALGELKGRLLGDGLVPLASALGQHADPARTLAFAASRQWTGYGMNHLDLLNHPEVADRLRHWLKPVTPRVRRAAPPPRKGL